MAETRVVAGDAHVARHGQVEAATEAVAANGGDGRFGTGFNRPHQRLSERRKRQSLYRSERADFREVGTRGKGLRRAGDDGSADRGIRRNAFKAGKQFAEDSPSESGELVGTVERYQKHGAVQNETDGGVHRALGLLALGHSVLNELHNVLRRGAGEENFGDARLFENGDICFGNDASDEHGHVGHSFFSE